jgi:hypothetical protein
MLEAISMAFFAFFDEVNGIDSMVPLSHGSE